MVTVDGPVSRSRDLDKLLLRPGNLVGPDFEPGVELREGLKKYVKVLVVGAGGLGCELLKDLALSGFRNLEVIDMDRIEVTNLNRQFLFRLQDVGKPKAEVAAKRVMERVSGVNIVPHFCRIEEKELDFYSEFNIIVLGLDSIEARSYINSVGCSFLEYDDNDNPIDTTIKPMVDGGTEGFKGHARVILPGKTPCFECTIWLFPPQVKFPLCTLAETPRTAAHCIEYAHLIKWDEVHSGKAFDPDEPDHMNWVYSEAVKRAELFGIQGVTYQLTQGVVKNIIPAIASTNAIISAACALETLKIATDCSKTLSNYLTYNGAEGLHTKVTEFVRDRDCLVCGPGVLIELDTSTTLQKFIDLLEEHPKLLLSKASITHRGKNLYMQSPPILEEMTRSNLSHTLFHLMGEIPKDVVHATGTASKNGLKTSSLRKLRVVFRGADGTTNMLWNVTIEPTPDWSNFQAETKRRMMGLPESELNGMGVEIKCIVQTMGDSYLRSLSSYLNSFPSFSSPVKIPIKNRHVLITRGSSGIGLAHGAAVCTCVHTSKKKLDEAVSMLARDKKKLDEAEAGDFDIKLL